jgi:hypothetical protein
MNLNDLKPAWKQFRILNSIEAIDEKEILFIIEEADRRPALGRLPVFLTNTVLFIMLTICCQGG